MLSKKKILKYIGIVILIKIVAFTLFLFYSIEETKTVVQKKTLKINAMEVIEVPKKEVLSLSQIEKQKNKAMQWKLEDKMKTVYQVCIDCYDDSLSNQEVFSKITSKLETLEDIDIFIADYHEETLYGSNDYKDINARTVALEEIQKVRRRGSGFIVSNLDSKGKKRYVLVKDLDALELYVGINFVE